MLVYKTVADHFLEVSAFYDDNTASAPQSIIIVRKIPPSV